MDSRFWNLGILKIKRGESAPDPYIVEELGNTPLNGDDEVDLIQYYDGSWDAVCNLCYKLTSAKLYKDIEAGIIIVTAKIPPTPKVNFLM